MLLALLNLFRPIHLNINFLLEDHMTNTDLWQRWNGTLVFSQLSKSFCVSRHNMRRQTRTAALAAGCISLVPLTPTTRELATFTFQRMRRNGARIYRQPCDCSDRILWQRIWWTGLSLGQKIRLLVNMKLQIQEGADMRGKSSCFLFRPWVQHITADACSSKHFIAFFF